MRSFSLIVSLLVFCVGIPPVFGKVIFQDDFDGYTNSISGWGAGTNVTLQNNGGIDNSKCARVNYTSKGTGPYYFSKNILSHKLSEIYVRFYFKVDYPSGGSKFLKLFGESDAPVGYANTTFALNYSSNTLNELSYGDGSGTSNDTQTIIRYSGKAFDSNVNVVKFSNSFDPRDGKWHCFEAHMKYNTNGKRDGVYRVWIDGNLRIHATNVKNRNDKNSMFFRSVDLANYCSDKFENAWNLWYDNVVISTEPIGTLGSVDDKPQSPPGTPINFRVSDN